MNKGLLTCYRYIKATKNEAGASGEIGGVQVGRIRERWAIHVVRSNELFDGEYPEAPS